MTQANPPQPQLQFLTCPQCQGRGKLAQKNCAGCQGLGLLAWTGRNLLYWGKTINSVQVAQDKIVQLVKNGINLSLFLFGALGVVMLGWVVISMVEAKILVWYFYRFRNWQLFIFWLSILTDSYLFYRWHRQLEKMKQIPKKKYQTDSPLIKDLTWPAALNLDQQKKIDVAKYFTAEAQAAITKSWQLSQKHEDAQTAPIHLFIALLDYPPIQVIFSRLGIPFGDLKNRIINVLAAQPIRTEAPVVFNNQLKEIIFQAYFLAYQLRQKKVEITELLEALVSPDNQVKELLYDLNITGDKITNVIAWRRIRKQLLTNWQRFRQKASLRPKNTMNRAMTAIATPVLDAFSQDLTRLAQAGYLMPCIGRDTEIEAIFNVMAGGTRQSVILIGQPGVGKDTVIEGVAQRMVEENVPDFLQDKRLVSLNIAKLVSGTGPTQAQERLLTILTEIRRSGNIILSIADIQ